VTGSSDLDGEALWHAVCTLKLEGIVAHEVREASVGVCMVMPARGAVAGGGEGVRHPRRHGDISARGDPDCSAFASELDRQLAFQHVEGLSVPTVYVRAGHLLASGVHCACDGGVRACDQDAAARLALKDRLGQLPPHHGKSRDKLQTPPNGEGGGVDPHRGVRPHDLKGNPDPRTKNAGHGIRPPTSETSEAVMAIFAIVLPYETTADYDALLRTLQADLAPVGRSEELLARSSSTSRGGPTLRATPRRASTPTSSPTRPTPKLKYQAKRARSAQTRISTSRQSSCKVRLIFPGRCRGTGTRFIKSFGYHLGDEPACP